MGEWLLFERKVTDSNPVVGQLLEVGHQNVTEGLPGQERIGGVTHSLFLNFCSVYLLKLLLNTKKRK